MQLLAGFLNPFFQGKLGLKAHYARLVEWWVNCWTQTVLRQNQPTSRQGSHISMQYWRRNRFLNNDSGLIVNDIISSGVYDDSTYIPPLRYNNVANDTPGPQGIKKQILPLRSPNSKTTKILKTRDSEALYRPCQYEAIFQNFVSGNRSWGRTKE